MEKSDGYWLDCDFISGACYSYGNGVNHISAAQIFAGNNNYGFAVSHLVLGAEELIKSLILLFLNTDSNFINNKKKEKLFSNHLFKHLKIKNFLIALTSKYIDEYDNNFFDYYFEGNYQNNFQQKAHYLNRVLKLNSIDEREVDDLTELISDANNLKNRGFYIDYDTDWKIPEDVQEETYKRYHGLVNKLMSFAQPLFTNPLTDDNLIRFIYGD